MRYLFLVVLLFAIASSALAAWPPTPGQTGSLTVSSPYAQNGAKASLWGFYAKTGGWVNWTFGTGIFSGGSATINYTVPPDFVSDFYWNVVAYYSTTSDEKGQYQDYEGAWDQFLTSDPNGTTVTVPVYQLDQRKVTTTAASFRASAQNGTVFPPEDLIYWPVVSVRRPWTGTLAQYSQSAIPDNYYDHSKTSLLPTRAANKGFLIELLEGNPGVQQFQKIRLYKPDESYSVELFGYKNASGDDPLGYLWWTTLVDVASADCSYNGATGVFSGSFGTALPTGIMYFVVPEFDVKDAVGSSKSTWIQAGSGTDLLTSGSSFQANILSLDPTPASIYVKTTETVVVDMNVSNLAQPVAGVQAFLNFSSTYFNAGPGEVNVVAGGGDWDMLIWNQWTSGGDLDVAVGVKVQGEGEPQVGTQIDATTAIITLQPKAEGITTVVFRPNADPDPGLTASTFLSDMNAQPVWPVKVDSVSIYIDDTPPAGLSIVADPASWTKDASVALTFSATDAISGIDHYELSLNGGGFFTAASPYAWDVSGLATGTYAATVKAIDKAGNEATASTTVYIDKTGPVVTIPADYSTNSAQVSIAASAIDPNSGVASFTMNSVPFTSPTTVTLVPGANTFTFVATDAAVTGGNSTTETLTITYNQPAPGITILKSVAPNVYGGASYLNWQANSRTGVLNGTSPVGSGYEKYEAVTADQDYTVDMVTNFNSWLGIFGSPGEYGNRLTYIYRIDNGVQTNPGAAKLDLNKVVVEMRNYWTGADNPGPDDYADIWGYDWSTRTDIAGFGAGNARLKGYNWVGGAWVEVVGGRSADLIIFDNAPGYDNGSDPAGQDTLNNMYKMLSGAVVNKQYDPLNTKRQTLTKDEYQVTYNGDAFVGSADVTANTNYTSSDTTDPVITISSPADGLKTNVAAQTIAGTVTDIETLASGVREVKVYLNSGLVNTYTTSDPVSFSDAVTLVEGNNVITVDAKDFAGNTATKTINVLLDTALPVISIDSAIQGGVDLLPGTPNALQGTVTITVSASDASAGLVPPPVVKVKDSAGVETTLTAVGSGPWTYTYTVDSSTANGIATITATVSDEAGNSNTATGTFNVNKNQIAGNVELQGFVGGIRTVTFVANGGLKTWAIPVTFTGAVGSYTLTDVPDGVTALSAKTAWNLRKKQACSLDGSGQAALDFIGTNKLLGGDVNNTNSINVLDYAILKVNWFKLGASNVANINGDGAVNDLDYALMVSNWFKVGEAL